MTTTHIDPDIGQIKRVKNLESLANNLAENYFLHFAIRQNAILNNLSQVAPQKYLDNLVKLISTFLYRPIAVDNSIKTINMSFSNQLFELRKKTKVLEDMTTQGVSFSRSFQEDGSEIISVDTSADIEAV